MVNLVGEGSKPPHGKSAIFVENLSKLELDFPGIREELKDCWGLVSGVLTGGCV
jgi:hypothetical protein